MRDNLDNILNHGECISEEMMLKYLEGRLNASEQHAMEKHLLGCELCADAFEGLSAQSIPLTRADLDNLDKKIEARTGQKSGRTLKMQWPYRIAAVIALVAVFGGGFYYLQSIKKSEKIFTENFQPYHETTPATSPSESQKLEMEETGSVTEQSGRPPAQPDRSISKNERSVYAEADGSGMPSVVASKQLADSLVVQPTTVAMEAAKSDDKIIADAAVAKTKDLSSDITDDESKNKKELSEYSITGNAALKTNQRQSMSEKKSANTKFSEKINATTPASQPSQENAALDFADSSHVASGNLIKEAFGQYEAKNYSAAVSMLQPVIEKEPRNAEALFYSGVSNLSLDEDAAAIRLFESVLKNTPNKFTDAAKWYLSLAYIKKNKTAKAKKILEELAAGTSEYRANARKTLDELK